MVGRVAGAATGKVLDTLDPDLWLSHIDLDALLERVDVQRLVDRIDPNPLLERVDVQRLADRVDLDVLVGRMDLEALVRRSGMPQIVAESTERIAKGTLDLPRRQIVGVDTLVGHGLDRLLRRRFDSTELLPARFTPPAAPEAARPGAVKRLTVTGHYSGPFGRLVAALIDAALVSLLFTAAYACVAAVAQLFFHWSVSDHTSAAAGTTLAVVWPFAYVFVSLSIAGRTLGKGVVGMRVVDSHGEPLSPGRAFVRTVMMPVSVALAGLGLLPIVFHREHRALHDLVAGTSVVIDWGDRPAELPGPLSAFVARRSPGPLGGT